MSDDTIWPVFTRLAVVNVSLRPVHIQAPSLSLKSCDGLLSLTDLFTTDSRVSQGLRMLQRGKKEQKRPAASANSARLTLDRSI